MDQSVSVERVERSIADTPTWSVATVTTVMVLICFVVERSIYRFGKWLRKTKRKALLASLEKIKEELMLLGLISLMLGQWSRWISSFCVKSSLFGSEFYPCSKDDMEDRISIGDNVNNTVLRIERLTTITNPCQEGYEPFVSYESLEQLHRFLFLLGVTHVFYSCFTVVLATVKIYSWKKWEAQSNAVPVENLQARRNAMMKRQTTFVFHHTSHPWSKNKVLIWMLCFFRQFMTSIKRSDYLALRLGFITNHRLPLSYDFHKYMVRSMEDDFHGIVGISWPLWGYAIVCIFINIHGLNIYFWLSFIPAILILLVGTKLQHVVANLALEIVETNGPINGSQVKPRDELFWFGKPELLLWLIQFTSFQNAFEMATFIWSVWGTKTQSCFVKDHTSLVIRLISGILAQFWCSYFTLPLNVIITQMGSRFKKALIAESVRESLYDWCKRVKEKSKYKRMGLLRTSTTSTCSLASTVEDRDDETFTVASGTISRCHSSTSHRTLSLNHVTVECADQEDKNNLSDQQLQIASLEASGYSSDSSDEVLSVDSHDSGIAEEEITHLEEDERIIMSSSVQSPTITDVVRNVSHESNA